MSGRRFSQRMLSEAIKRMVEAPQATSKAKLQRTANICFGVSVGAFCILISQSLNAAFPETLKAYYDFPSVLGVAANLVSAYFLYERVGGIGRSLSTLDLGPSAQAPLLPPTPYGGTDAARDQKKLDVIIDTAFEVSIPLLYIWHALCKPPIFSTSQK